MISKYTRATTKRVNESQQPETTEQTHTLSFNTPRESGVYISKQNESGLKNASIAGIVTTPRLGGISQPAKATRLERMTVEIEDMSKSKKLVAKKTNLSPEKSKNHKTMSVRSNRENDNLRSSKEDELQ